MPLLTVLRLVWDLSCTKESWGTKRWGNRSAGGTNVFLRFLEKRREKLRLVSKKGSVELKQETEERGKVRDNADRPHPGQKRNV